MKIMSQFLNNTVCFYHIFKISRHFVHFPKQALLQHQRALKASSFSFYMTTQSVFAFDFYEDPFCAAVRPLFAPRLAEAEKPFLNRRTADGRVTCRSGKISRALRGFCKIPIFSCEINLQREGYVVKFLIIMIFVMISVI